MITIDVMGGLGNQLFMIFTTLAYSIRYNVKPVFPHKNCYNDGVRIHYWDTFFKDIAYLTTNNPELQVSESHRCSFARYVENGFHYQPIPYFENQDVCLSGYFQSPKYFEDVVSNIFKMINLYDKQMEIREKYSQYFTKTDSDVVCMHFRLGDYKTKRMHHPIMNYEYFEQSLAFIVANSSITVSRVIYLCEKEDTEYVQRQINRLQITFPSLEFVQVEDGIPDYEQLLIMSCCDHNIMSNSTFSWWGAYLNYNANKVVCYPSVWFGQEYPNNNTKDLMLPSWNKITANPIPWQNPLE
jgi:hypothetical protein